MKRFDIRAAFAALLLAGTVAAQPAQPPGGMGPRGMAASDQAKTFDSKSLGTPVTYVAYLPADYETSKTSYPVIYALHGMFENSAFLERRGLTAQIDDLVRSGVAPNAIIVTVDGGNNLFVNSGKGKYQDMVTKDLVEYIDKTYRTVAKREGRALLGVSMGGYGALNIAFSHPEVFGVVATHSAMLLTEIPTIEAGARGGQMRAFTGVFGEPVDPVVWKADDPLELARTVDAKKVPALYFDCGAQDRYGLFKGNEALHTILDGRKIATDFSISPGDHGYEFVKSVLPKSMAFLKKNLATK
ncbi:MAG: alpha/beta hydrolase family protein [Vicinamibacteria bacterium]